MEIAALNITPKYHPQLLRMDHGIAALVHVLPPDIHWHVALTREYWYSAIGRLSAGDRIEVHSHDHKIQFQIFIFDCNDQTAQIRLDMGFAPIWPRDLELPAPMEDPALFKIVPARSGGGFVIVETATGNKIATAPEMLTARQMVSALEVRDRQLREQAEQTAAAELASDTEATVAALARAGGDEAA